jgi:bacillithiol system protein YtxJ
MNWTNLQTIEELETLKKESFEHKVLIFKHSTTCSISKSALNRIERNWNDTEMQHLKPFYLDLLSFRPISSQIAQDFGIQHESPQVLVIENGKCVYNSSHVGIQYQDLQAL